MIIVALRVGVCSLAYTAALKNTSSVAGALLRVLLTDPIARQPDTVARPFARRKRLWASFMACYVIDRFC